MLYQHQRDFCAFAPHVTLRGAASSACSMPACASRLRSDAHLPAWRTSTYRRGLARVFGGDVAALITLRSQLHALRGAAAHYRSARNNKTKWRNLGGGNTVKKA